VVNQGLSSHRGRAGNRPPLQRQADDDFEGTSVTRSKMRAFTQTEQEVIVLKAVWELIAEMVNYEMFLKPTRTSDVQLMFHTITHGRLFNILLVDFLSEPNATFGLPSPPRQSPMSDQSYLFYLRRVCNCPTLNRVADSIKTPLEVFVQWLETECLVEKVWLPSIQLEPDIKVKRIAFIRICGNIAKHSFTRLNRDADLICKILKANGHSIDVEQAYLVIPEFYEWFHAHIFSYHSSAIAEFLNNIRWGIYDYLKPEFVKAFTKDNPASTAYRFIHPAECDRPVAQALYCDLMNAVRSEPYMPRFEVTRYLKMRY
jgi:hypothetical protein